MNDSNIYFRNINKQHNIFHIEDWTKDELEKELSNYINTEIDKTLRFGLIFQTNDYRCCCRNGSHLIKIFKDFSKELLENYWINNITDTSEIDSIKIYDDYAKLLYDYYEGDALTNDILGWGKLEYKTRNYNYRKWFGSYNKNSFTKIYNKTELVDMKD